MHEVQGQGEFIFHASNSKLELQFTCSFYSSWSFVKTLECPHIEEHHLLKAYSCKRLRGDKLPQKSCTVVPCEPFSLFCLHQCLLQLCNSTRAVLARPWLSLSSSPSLLKNGYWVGRYNRETCSSCHSSTAFKLCELLCLGHLVFS